MLTAALLAVAAILVGVVVLRRMEPAVYVLSIPVREYADAHYCVNPFAEQDSRAITSCFPGPTASAVNSQTQARIVEELRKLAEHADQPIVVHITCLALVNEGELYLLPGDARPNDVTSWLALKTALRLISESGASKILVLLDIAHGLVDARLGILSDRVMEHAEAELARGKSMFVLCSCAAGQVAQASEEWRTSVFAHYVCAGLRGEADGWNAQRYKDNRVTVKELAAFVQTRTSWWSEQNGLARQTPFLLGEGQDFALVIGNGAESKTDEAEEYPKWLVDGWTKRDDLLQKQEAHRYAPQQMHQLEAGLLRLEQRWRGGFESARIKEEMAALLKERLGQVKDAQPVSIELPAYSLALEKARLPLSSQPLIPTEKMQDLLDQVRDLDKGARAAETAKAVDKFLAEIWLPDVKKAKTPMHLTAAAWFEALAGVPRPRPPQLAFVKQRLEDLQLGKRHVETLWVERLIDFAGNRLASDDKWPEDAVRQSLQALQSRETLIVLASQEPALVGIIDKEFDLAEKARWEGENLLLWGGQEQWPKAAALLLQAVNGYHRLSERIRSWQSARRVLEDALARLWGYMPYLTAAPNAEHEEKLWLAARDHAQEIVDALALSPRADIDAGKVGLLTRELEELQKRWDTQAHALSALGAAGNAKDLEQMTALLASPRLDAKRRQPLWEALRKLQGRLRDRTERGEQDRMNPAPLTMPRKADYWPLQAGQAWQRARLALGLLELAGVENLSKPLETLRQAKSGADPQRLDTLADLTRNAWMWQFPEQVRSAKLSLPWPDRTSRVAPVDAQSIARSDQPQQQRDFKDWLAMRLQDEYQFLRRPDSQEAQIVSDFFKNAAVELGR